ncbi:MAG TPA: hypothetical protein VL361_24795 [Candidatus Limnocylindrales bacterium]|nr:hypothetical protein [Candidatus Limnocylindrales bacterium]
MRIGSWSGTGLVVAWSALCSLASAEPLSIPSGATTPQWSKPFAPVAAPNLVSVRSQELELIHAANELGCFLVRVAGKDYAIGQNRPFIAYLTDGTLRWFEVAAAADKKVTVTAQGSAIVLHWQGTDPDGAHWQVQQQFRAGTLAGTIDVESEMTVDQDRQVAFLPILMIFPGAGSFGVKKGQALFAGLEYLANEPSSSEADVIGRASKRQVPDNLKITFPLMVIQDDDRYLGLVWQMRPHFSALFDSPDRLFGSGGHVMGLIFPGSNGKDREEGNLLPRSAGTLSARAPLVLRATLLGGSGKTIVPAIQQYVRLRGMPPLPVAPNLQQYVSLAAGGWLDSKIRQGPLVRHAIAEGNFPAGPAADAAVWMNWLAEKTQRPEVASRLRQAAEQVIGAVSVQDLYGSGVGHIRYPLAPLVFGHVPESIERAAGIARGLIARFDADGALRYRPSGGPDFAKTHFTNEASGFVSRAVEDLLQVAAYSGDRELISVALQRLDAMDKFRNDVPRGAQTWECPLHTPDILASAQMVRAYTLGYELTANPAYLEQARYWAWTGVPFVYLLNPSSGVVGSYSTIAVFGATQWQAPVWMGLPVQWCGLVYADALYRLVRHDSKGPWKKLADGITISGIDQSWPGNDAQFQGLLPDSFVLRAQHRNGPAINPATVQACAARFFDSIPTFDFHCFPKSGVRLYAPGEIDKPAEKQDRISFRLKTWVNGVPYYVLVNGLPRKPQLKIDGKATDCSAPHEFLEKQGQLILKLVGNSQIDIVL